MQTLFWHSRFSRHYGPSLILLTADDMPQGRRKQIRDAQRAYRSRQKDLFISLQERNGQLEDAIGHLSQIMHSFHEVRSNAALPLPKLPEAVDILEKEIIQQLRRAERSSIGYHPKRPEENTNFNDKMQRLLVQPSSDLVKAACPPPSISRQSDSPFWTSFLQTSHPLIPKARQTPCESSFGNPLAVTDSHDKPISYATTPFTQRLFKACAESGHRYLTNEAVSDREMWHEFGLVLQDTPRAEVASYFKRVLAAVPCNPIQDFRFPFISLGGAGSHFSVKRMSIITSGLQNLLPFQTTNGIKEVPSDEEWFDIHDVEGYLTSRNILLQSSQSSQTPMLLDIAKTNTKYSIFGHPLPLDQQDDVAPAIFIDEDFIISELSRLCICIGCAAAFRRRDVEALISHSAQPLPVANLQTIT
ncbi:uncharacterized protein N7469_006716 [Penicillium citrinum]|uniref:Uncharacterized protein n=1 Tax=Penicillium citrinum TaxID=5077 RepID=A0A9W9NUZ5_PENCI|nr:uncharacterized protein N7469_006716 [Penicillium citrinum]KAJ5226710.1 hypothetical protein N7469_006716 [Penicillium citrinum]